MKEGPITTWIAVSISAIAVLIIPSIALMYKIVTKWARLETKLDGVIEDLKELVNDKDKVHTELAQTIREDRATSDRRLRWLEENLWKGTKN